MNNANSKPLSEFSYFGTGGMASTVFAPSSNDELVEQLQSLNRNAQIELLGLGSNSLIGDDPFDGVFILFKELNHYSIKNSTIIAGAGVENTMISELAYQNGLKGAEWLYRLPGQIGATTRMNARCYGGEISQIVSKVITLSYHGEYREYSNPEMFKGYKDTIFMSLQEMIVEVHLSLSKTTETLDLQKKMDFCQQDRQNKGQFKAPSCGCVFKNDYRVGIPSGMLLENAGAKELSVGGAQVSKNHANFIFNINKATAKDILTLSFLMRERVYEKFGVWLSYEMELLGKVSPELKKQFLSKKPNKPNMKILDPLKKRFREVSNIHNSTNETNNDHK